MNRPLKPTVPPIIEAKSKGKRRTALTIGAGLLLTAVALVTWAPWRSPPRDPAVERIRAVMATVGPGSGLAPEAQLETMTTMRKEIEALSDDQRKQLFAEGPPMMRQMAERAHAYAKLPHEEKIRFLDAEIERMQQFRALMERGGAPPPFGPPGGPGTGPGNGGPGAGPPGGFSQFLNNTTPEDRAAVGKFMTDMNSRLQELGLPGPPMPPPPSL